MTVTTLSLVSVNYGFLWPIRAGDIRSSRIELALDLDTPRALARSRGDSPPPAGEYSLMRHLVRVARGDRSIIAIPFFPHRAFPHRGIVVAADSPLDSLGALAGKRIGTATQASTGDLWRRYVLYRSGVPSNLVTWHVGKLSDPEFVARTRAVRDPRVDDDLPSLLFAGEIDAYFGQPVEGTRRLLVDYPVVERTFYRETGIFPINHVYAVHRETIAEDPSLLLDLYDLLEEARLYWKKEREAIALAESTPWFENELEQARASVGRDWAQNGFTENREGIAAIIEAARVDGLISASFEPEELFSEFLTVREDTNGREPGRSTGYGGA